MVYFFIERKIKLVVCDIKFNVLIDGFDEIIIFLIFNKFMYIVGDCFII